MALDDAHVLCCSALLETEMMTTGELSPASRSPMEPAKHQSSDALRRLIGSVQQRRRVSLIIDPPSIDDNDGFHSFDALFKNIKIDFSCLFFSRARV